MAVIAALDDAGMFPLGVGIEIQQLVGEFGQSDAAT
jgi:hypothetical protein